MTSKTRQHDAPAARGSILELKQMLKEFDTALLTSITPEGLLHARPMAVQDPEEVPDCDLWFVTSTESAKAGEIAQERQVGVGAYRSRDRSWLSISAWAAFERDEALIRRLFKPSWKAWFVNGPDDPTIVILKLMVERAEYWEPEGGRARVLYEMLKARLRGEPADANLNPPKTV
jgi:general stress protein 26